MRACSRTKSVANLVLASNKITSAQEGYLERYRNHTRHMLDVSSSVAARLMLLLTVSAQVIAKPNTETAQPIPRSRLRTTDPRRHHESCGIEGD